MLPFVRVYPQVNIVEIPIARVIAVVQISILASIGFRNLFALHGANFIVPGPVVIENDDFTGADGYFFTGKAA